MSTYGIALHETGESGYAEQDLSKVTHKYNDKGDVVYGGIACIGGVDGTVTYRKFGRGGNGASRLSEAEYQQLKQQDPTAVQGYIPYLGATFVVIADATGNRLPGYITARGNLALTAVSARQPGKMNIFNVIALGRHPAIAPYDLMAKVWPRDPNDSNRLNMDIRGVVLWMLAGHKQTPLWEVTFTRAGNGALYVNECAPVSETLHMVYNQILAPYRALPEARRFVEKEGPYGVRYQPHYKELESILGTRLVVQPPQVVASASSQTVQFTGPQVVPPTSPQSVGHASPQTVQQTPPQNLQSTGPQVAPEATPQATPQTSASSVTPQFSPSSNGFEL